MNVIYDDLMKAYASIQRKISTKPKVALVLGSGLGEFAEHMENRTYIAYKDIEGFPVSTVSGHAGTYVLGTVEGVDVIAMQGRVHYYEGYSMDKVVMPIRIMKLLGAQTLILTNAAGGMNSEFTPGDLMMITDHITSFVPSPLIGENIEELGTRFPDMSSVYDKELQALLDEVAKNQSISLKKGVYLQTTGPNYETPAEIKLYRSLGADAVGMSTACEAMAARHMGMKIAGISCITNLAAGMGSKPLDHKEVKENADKIAQSFEALVKNFIIEIGALDKE